MTLAHPLTEPAVLPLAPAVIGLLAVVVVWVAGTVGAPGSRGARVAAPRPVDPGPLTRSERFLRGVGALAVLATIVAGLVGPQDQLRNVAPALVVGVAWPLLIAAAWLGVDVWHHLNASDGLARLVAPLGADDGAADPASVHPATVAAAAWTGYLAIHPDPLRPRNVAVALAAYVFIALAGSLAIGRVAWLSRWDALGLLTSWLHRPAQMGRRDLPRGAAALIAVTYAGSLLPAVVRSDLLGTVELADHGPVWWAVTGIGLAAALTAVLHWSRRQLEPDGVGAAAVTSALLGLAGVVVAVALTAGRLTTSVQILARLATGSSRPIYPYLLDAPTIAVVQVVVIVAGHVAGALVLRRVSRGRPRQRAVAVLGLLTATSVLVTTSPFG